MTKAGPIEVRSAAKEAPVVVQTTAVSSAPLLPTRAAASGAITSQATLVPSTSSVLSTGSATTEAVPRTTVSVAVTSHSLAFVEPSTEAVQVRPTAPVVRETRLELLLTASVTLASTRPRKAVLSLPTDPHTTGTVSHAAVIIGHRVAGLETSLVTELGHEPYVLGPVKEHVEPIGVEQLQGSTPAV